MTLPAVTTTWGVFSASVQGANHVRTGQPNQDAVATVPAAGSGEQLILAVSDGHGSEAYTRSDVGARIATQVMAELGQELLDLAGASSLSAVKAIAEGDLPRRLVRAWRERVLADARGTVGSEAGAAAADEDNLIRPYGATLIGAVVTPEFLALWQLGDGDILVVDDSGALTTPLAPPGLQLGVETESLLSKNAWQQVRVHWMSLQGDAPALVLLSSDGLANSYASNDAFLQFGSDVLARIREGGLRQVCDHLPGWLSRATEFSGDDVTVAGACRGEEP